MHHAPIAKPPSVTKSSLPIGRLLRIGLGAFLLALFAYALLPGTLTGAVTAGRINAELITLRSPIDGRIAFGAERVGDRVQQGADLGVVADPPERDVRLPDLEAQLKSIEERRTGIIGQLASLEPILERLGTESRDFRSAVTASLDAQVAQAQAQLKRADASLQLTELQLKRIQPLAAKGFATQADLDQRKAAVDTAHADQAAARKALERLLKERAAAENGIYLTDSYNNAPYSQQRRDEVELQRLTLTNRRIELDAEREQLRSQIDAERRRRQQVGEAVFKAPANGVLWRLLVSNGATIGTGAAVIQMVDCSRLFFEVTRDRRGEETPAIGTTADITFSDAGKTYARTGRLVAIRGEQDSDRGEFAIASAPQPDQLRLIYALAPAGGQDAPAACPVGQSGRLNSGDSLLGRLVSKVSGLTGRLSGH